MKIGAVIKRLRESSEITQEALAKAIELDPSRLSRIENDFRPAPPDLLDKAVKAMRRMLQEEVNQSSGRLASFNDEAESLLNQLDLSTDEPALAGARS